jgi:DNA-3-methyladenine glycosylase I
LKKQQGFREAYDGFDIQKIASYTPDDEERLRNDARIIRNKLKIKAAIHNAQQVLKIQKTHGSFETWLNQHHPRNKLEWIELFQKTFKFTGGEITTEFLKSLGYLPGAHHPDCVVYKKILETKPAWTTTPDFDWKLDEKVK